MHYSTMWWLNYSKDNYRNKICETCNAFGASEPFLAANLPAKSQWSKSIWYADKIEAIVPSERVCQLAEQG